LLRNIIFTDYVPDIAELFGFPEYLNNLFFFESLSHIPSSWVKSNISTGRKSWAGQLEIPRYPPIEVLVTIADAFDIYMAAGGALTLEDVFFGPAKKGVGNYAARKAKDDVYRNFHMYLSLEKLEAKHRKEMLKDLESIATEYIAYGENPIGKKFLNIEPDYIAPDCGNNPDPESFLRGYRRWKKKVAAKNNDPDN